MQKTYTELAPEVEVDGRTHHLHLDYALHEPGESHLSPGTEVFRLKTCLETGNVHLNPYRFYTIADCLVLHCIDRQHDIYERIGIVRPYRETVYEERFSEQIPRSVITLV